MRRFVHNTLLFALLAALFVALATMLLGGHDRLRNVSYRLGMWDFTHTRIAEAEKTHDVDILFLGSSHCYRSFDPRFHAARGLATFNLGSSNQTPLQSEMLLRLYLDTMRPRLVVVEVHPDVVRIDGVESSIYLTNNMKPSIPMACMALRTHNARAILTMLYSAAHNTLTSDLDSYTEPLTSGGNNYIAGGFVERREGCFSPEWQSPMTVSFPRAQMRALRSIVDMLGRRGIPCLLVEVPDTRCIRQRYTNHDEFCSRMAALAPFRSVEVGALDDSLHFYDAEHLNQAGVEIFQRVFYDSVLVPFMNENQLFTNR